MDFSELDSFAYFPDRDSDTSEYRTIFEERVVQEVNHQMKSRSYTWTLMILTCCAGKDHV